MDKFISDPHLSHQNIILFERKNFKTIQEHDSFIKHIIQSNVKPSDTLYILGDVGKLSEENILFWKSLPCKTILIRGNHDKQKSKLLDAFDVVSDVPIFYQKRILLSHEPLPVTNETINIHGHLHGAKLNSKNHLNISIHVAKYQILTEKDINILLSTTPKIAQKFMFEWYADKYIFEIENKDVIYKFDKSIDIQKSKLQQIKNGKMNKTLTSAIKSFLKEFPNYKHADPETFITEFLMSKYQNNSNFTPKDIEDFILNPKEGD